MSAAYYIYALKDPRTNPAKPFYIGKGTGTRKFDHFVKVDDTLRSATILLEILNSPAKNPHSEG